MRLWSPATFFIISVCRRRGFRHRSAATRQIFNFPIPCSTTTRFRPTRRFPAFCRAVSFPFRGLRRGVFRSVPRYAVSPYPATPAGISTPARSNTFLSWTEPGKVGETATIRTRRRCRPRPGRFLALATTTWVLSVCRFFFPD